MTTLSVLDYLTDPVTDRVSYDDFLTRPFHAFLRQSVHLADAFNSCLRHFPKKPVRKDEYTKDSIHSMQEIATPLLASLMSNLELLQRSVYAKLFDLSSHIPDFDTTKLLKNLRSADVDVGIHHVVGYRGAPAAAGNIVANALSGWHDPRKVNQYFKALLNIGPFYPDEVHDELGVLWQMRHSIVHTGGTLTAPDSQKLLPLVQYGERAVVFRHQFILAVVVRFHKILKGVRDNFYPKVTARFKTRYRDSVKRQIDELFFLDSPRKSWLA